MLECNSLMKIDSETFSVCNPIQASRSIRSPPGKNLLNKSAKKYRAMLQEHVSALSDPQQLLYGSDRYAFQGMDVPFI